MDETPEELEQIRREADSIDPYRYRNRRRIFGAIVMGAVLAGVVFVIFEAIDVARNPCERVRDHYCKQDAKSLNCTTYTGVFEESVEDTSPMARSSIRHQCETHIKRLKLDENIEVP
jgi:hypothetical protein